MVFRGRPDPGGDEAHMAIGAHFTSKIYHFSNHFCIGILCCKLPPNWVQVGPKIGPEWLFFRTHLYIWFKAWFLHRFLCFFQRPGSRKMKFSCGRRFIFAGFGVSHFYINMTPKMDLKITHLELKKPSREAFLAYIDPMRISERILLRKSQFLEANLGPEKSQKFDNFVVQGPLDA